MFMTVFCVTLSLLAASSAVTTTTSPKTTSLSLDHFFRMTFHTVDFDHDGVHTFQEFEKMWSLADVNGDGIITLDEYSTSAHFSRFIAMELFKYIDHDHNNVITLQEVPRIFMEYDSNSDGWVGEQEFVDEYFRIYQHVMKDIGPDLE